MTIIPDKARELVTRSQQLAATLETNITAALDSPIARAAHEKAQGLLNTPPVQRAKLMFRTAAFEATTPIRNWFVKNGMGATYDEYIVPALTNGKVVRSLAVAIALNSLSPVINMYAIANFGFFWKDMVNNDVNGAMVHLGWSLLQQAIAGSMLGLGSRATSGTAANFFGLSRQLACKFFANPGFDELADTLSKDAQLPTAGLPVAKESLAPSDQVLNNTLQDFSSQSVNLLVNNVANISSIGSSTYFLAAGLYTGSGSYLLAGGFSAGVIGLSLLRNYIVSRIATKNEHLTKQQQSAFAAMRNHIKQADENRRQLAANNESIAAEADTYFQKWKGLNDAILNNQLKVDLLNTTLATSSRLLPFSYIVSTSFGVPAHNNYNFFNNHIDIARLGEQVSASQNTINFADGASNAWAIVANIAGPKAAVVGLGKVVSDYTENRKPIALGGEKPQCDATQPVGLNVRNLVLKSSQNDITVDFAAKPGDRLLLSGLSARRKATLLNQLIGYFPHADQAIAYGGIDTLNGNLAVVLPQTKVQAPTLREALGIGATTVESTTAMTEVLEKIGFTPTLDDDSKHILDAPDDAEAFAKVAPNLTAAQQQLLQLASVALQKPRFVILDEAFAALNEEQIEKTCTLFKDRLKDSVVVSLENAHPAPDSQALAQFYTDTKNYGPRSWSLPLAPQGGISGLLQKLGLRL